MKTLFLVLLLCGSMAAQTVYYNHPKGVAIGGGSAGQTTTVAKLTLPAGTYHVIFKTELTAFSGGIDEGVDCAMNVTGIPNVSSPFAADRQKAVVGPKNFGSDANVTMVMESAFVTKGGTVKVQCITEDSASNVFTAFINLSATKISTLVRQ
jgi:hypothetical protein